MYMYTSISVTISKNQKCKMKTLCILFIFPLLLCVLQFHGSSVNGEGMSYEGTSSSIGTVGRLVKKEERRPLLSTEFGAISAVDVGDGTGRDHNYHLQFIILEPNSLFLPVLLHADMVFYVHTGSGRLSWKDSDEDKLKKVNLKRGDVYRLGSGALFYIHSSLETERQRLRVIAIFTNPDAGDVLEQPSVGPYSSINDLIRGFDKRVLQAAFQVPEEVIEEITSTTDTPAIVHAETERKKFWEDDLLMDAFLGFRRYIMDAAENKKKHSKSKTKAFNFFDEDPDIKNCNGWSTVVSKHNLHALHGSHIGVFMVNLTKGSMMGPHWNPKAAEVSVVLEGEGMLRVVCPSTMTSNECKNTRFRVEEGDIFTVPRFHPMSQTSFNNGSLVFVGFSTTTKKNHPQFLAGKASVLQTLDRLVLAASLNVSSTTIDELLASQDESIILECTSCAEEEEMLMEKEIEEEIQKEEQRKREEEEAKRREEEEQRRKEEEERRRHEEEEAKRREEEERRRKEEEEEQRRREEEERHQEEEERRRREEEAERRQEEEERRRREEEAERQREEEERRRREEEAEERRRREEEEEEQRRREEQEQRKREEEEARTREEEERRREEEEIRRQHEEEEQRKREAEEEWQQEEKERRRHEEEEEEEEERRREEQQREQEEEVARQREKEARRREERRQEEERRRREEEEEERKRKRGGGEETEEEAARREEEERVERERQEEEAARRRREERGRREEKETAEAAARREEEERWEWERQVEEAARKRRARREEERMKRERQEEEAPQKWREERGRGEEEETEEAAARREEEERWEWERRAEEAPRRRKVKLKRINRKHWGKKMVGEKRQDREIGDMDRDKEESGKGSIGEMRVLRRTFRA